MQHIGCLIVVMLLTVSCASGQAANLPPPFQSTPDEEKKVDHLLARWEQWNAGVKTFDCRFKRWTYDTVFGPPNQPRYVELGVLSYSAPDHWMFRVDTADKNGREVPVEDTRAEHWVFDGKSLIEYNHAKHRVIEHKLPPEVQGRQLVDGPLTFPPFAILSSVFGGPLPSSYPVSAKAGVLKAQYYLRTRTSADQPDQIWLDAYPRTSAVASRLQRLQLIFPANDMSPYAMKIVQPNGKDYAVYQFFDIAVNSLPTHDGQPFNPDWQRIVEEPPMAR